MYKIVLVEDEKDLNDLIKVYLEKEGYKVISYLNGQSAISNTNIDANLWILDIMLSDDISGFDIIKKIREHNKKIPIIFTSARDKDIDKITGLELGSDDYITKPYSPKELVLRVNNIIKRVYSDNSEMIIYDKYIIDTIKRTVSIKEKNKEIILTSLEFDLLYYFITNKNKSLQREQILETVWGIDYYGTDRVVDDLVRRLRKKMPKLKLTSIYGYGYRLV